MKKMVLVCLFLLVCSPPAKTSGLNPEFVTLREVMDKLEEIAQITESSQILKDEFRQLQKSHGIAGDEKTYKDFVRVRLAFEATRDSGLWQIRWAITDNEPSSDLIWQQWQKQTTPRFENDKTALATAECDELSALFAFIARGWMSKK